VGVFHRIEGNPTQIYLEVSANSKLLGQSRVLTDGFWVGFVIQTFTRVFEHSRKQVMSAKSVDLLRAALPTKRVPVWDTRAKKKIVGLSAPQLLHLDQYLRENPHMEVFKDQDLMFGDSELRYAWFSPSNFGIFQRIICCIYLTHFRWVCVCVFFFFFSSTHASVSDRHHHLSSLSPQPSHQIPVFPFP
jgi:hypothetical protein